MNGPATSTEAPLYGLILAGGHSRRMQQDKAALEYQGQRQLERAVALLENRVERTYVSVRAAQRKDPLRSRYDLIIDTEDDLGPAGGILAAQTRHPEVAWLVLACDLPFLDARSLDYLIDARARGRMATAYRSVRDGLPEPLCAIYEPASAPALAAALKAGQRCPRKFLGTTDTQLLEQPTPGALENVNTPTEFRRASDTLQRTTDTPASDVPAKRISVQYYALLREQAGCSSESVHTDAATPRELYEQLNARHPFTLPPELLRVAVNAEFAEWSAPLAEGDTVVFIPPVAGG